MRDATERVARKQLQNLLRSFLFDHSGAFGAVLKLKEVVALIGQEVSSRGERVFTPLVTLCTFLHQISSDDGSCRAAVAALNAARVEQGLAPCSAQTGGYCKARQRLPEQLFVRLLELSGQRLEEQTPSAWRWHGRSVKLVDGTTVSMPDTSANQQAYPQSDRQAPGCGFPIARVVVVLSLACGAALGAAISKYKGKRSGELALFDSLHEQLEADDVVLTDRNFCSYWEIASLAERGVDAVMRLHASRRVDFHRGQRLGHDDHLVNWTKPPRPRWMDKARYHAMPKQLLMRELRVQVTRPGFRTRVLIVATTLRDAKRFLREEIAALYRMRWHAELDLRSIKQTMGMDILRCQSPEMVRKELWAHLLVYNLLRAAMCQAALRQGQLTPRQLSLQGTRQTLAAFRSALARRSSARRQAVIEAVLDAIATHRVGFRPDRYEPRARKRRPKAYPRLTVPRPLARAQLERAA